MGFMRKLHLNIWLVFLSEKFHGQRSLAGYSSRGHKESDMTEHAHTHI